MPTKNILTTTDNLYQIIDKARALAIMIDHTIEGGCNRLTESDARAVETGLCMLVQVLTDGLKQGNEA